MVKSADVAPKLASDSTVNVPIGMTSVPYVCKTNEIRRRKDMANWSGGVLTAVGRALQLKVESGTKLELTKIKLGDGNETSAEVDNLTDLVSARAELAISAVKVSNGLCKVTGVILTTNVETGFYSREWGLFCQRPRMLAKSCT